MNFRKMPSVIIAGCGWLGKKLGNKLISEGYKVYGTTRSSSNFSNLNDLQILPVKLVLPYTKKSGIHLPHTDTAVISLSPGRGSEREQYVSNIGQLAEYFSAQNTRVIMYSSTSVYNGHENTAVEKDSIPDINSENVISAAEATLLKHCPDAVILRLSGLYGDDRHPATYMAGRKNIPDGDAPVNLVHSEDVIEVTEHILKNEISGEIFNVCSSVHPPKKQIYSSIIERLELKAPDFSDGGEHSKVVSSEKLLNKLKIELKHPDPSTFLLEEVTS